MKEEKGITLRTLVAIIYTILVFQPAIIWSNLATGIGIASISWISLFFFQKAFRLMGQRLTKQEAFLIMQVSSIAGISSVFINLIFRGYFINSPIVDVFGIKGYIPSWWVPHYQEAWTGRNLISAYWATPIALSIVSLMLVVISDIVMGLIARQLYIQGEKLPFPMQQVSAQAILTIVEGDKKRSNILLIGLNLAVLYSFALYGIPFLMELFGLVGSIGRAPIPWFDLNSWIHSFVPGASFGIATDILVFATGFILPLNVVLCILAGSIAVQFVGNALLIRLGLTQFSSEFFRGMSIAAVMQRSTLYAWAGPIIGVSIAAGMLPLIHQHSIFIQAFRSLARSRAGFAVASLWGLLGIWFAAAMASILLVLYLAPGYPLWIMLVFSLGWSLIWTLVDARAIGVAGTGIPIPGGVLPIVKYSYIATSGYSNYDIWFIDPVISTGGASWCADFKVAELCDASPSVYIKTYLIVLPIALITGFFYVQSFWSMAPMPSFQYPATAIYWPINAVNQALWYSGKMLQIYNVTWLAGAFAITSIVYAISAVFHIPISTIGLAAGVATPIPTAISYFIGAMISKFILERIFGEEWRKGKAVFVAGLAFGQAIIITVFGTLMMLSKSLWVMPY